jgi:hypothetical protein
MTPLTLRAFVLLVVMLLLGTPSAVKAAQSFDNCTGFIATVPVVIGSSGTWCLNQNLSTANSGGAAITVNTDNVTIDCNSFRLDGLAAGASTQEYGIEAGNRLNLTVRHCNVRGFLSGIYIFGSGGGHVVEDNRIDASTSFGIEVQGDGSVVRRNRVFNSGGSTFIADAYGIITDGSLSILDNTVSGVAATSGNNGYAYGIFTSANLSGVISGNRVRGLLKDGTHAALGIYNNTSDRLILRNNDLVGDGNLSSSGVVCYNTDGRLKDNEISGFGTAIGGCSNNGGNVIKP